MPTNANTFNSRVTSEALEKKFRDVFPAQGGAELVQDLYASGVITPVIDFSTVAEGSVLPEFLQTAWDFSTGHVNASNFANTFLTNTGFWKVQANATINVGSATSVDAGIYITDGLSSKPIWEVRSGNNPVNDGEVGISTEMVIFLKTGESLVAATNDVSSIIDVSWRQIADVNGNLVNPLGFTFS